jgi:excinuclease ABC subunit B
VKKNIGDILQSVYERDHVRADMPHPAVAKGGAKADEGALHRRQSRRRIWRRSKAQMRDAAADLDFETAARLRDEIKRLQEPSSST